MLLVFLDDFFGELEVVGSTDTGAVVLKDGLALSWCLADGGVLVDACIQEKVCLAVLEEAEDSL